jgi:alpha/beta hydrolase family protein
MAVQPLPDEPIVIARQGSFLAGGGLTSDRGDTFRGDHAYVQFQVPVHPRSLPLIFWHGGSTCGSGWESTPDGREGFQTLLLRRGFSTYVIDRPRKGRAGASLVEGTVQAQPFGDCRAWNIWRLGIWQPPNPPSLFPGLRMPTDEQTIDQFLRLRTPETGPASEAYMDVALAAIDALLERVGRSVLVLHSQGGKYGWLTRTRNDRVAGIVAYEPGAFIFPEDDPPEPVETSDPEVAGFAKPILVPADEFRRLTEIPIQLVYGDNIQLEPSSIMGVEFWRVNIERRRQFEAAVNDRGGSVEILDLPTLGLTGNTHFAFSDLGNDRIADLMVEYLESNGLA